MASLNSLLNPESSYESSLRLHAVRSPSSTTTSPTEKTSEGSSTAVELKPTPRTEVVIRAHEPHPDCPDTLACLPDTDGRPQHTLPVILRCTILGSPRKRLTIREIYAAMERKYPYYKTAGPAWKQSVRHHLSLNRLFERQPRPPSDPGFGSYWTVNLDAPPGTKRPRKRGGRSNKNDGSELGTIPGLGPVSPSTIIPVLMQPPLPALPGPPAPQPLLSATPSTTSTILSSSPNAPSTSSSSATPSSQIAQPPSTEDHLQAYHSPPHSPHEHVFPQSHLQPPPHPHQLAHTHAQSPHAQPQSHPHLQLPPHPHPQSTPHPHSQSHPHSVSSTHAHPHTLPPASHSHPPPPPSPYAHTPPQGHQHTQSLPPSHSHHPHQHSQQHPSTSTHTQSVSTIAKLRPVDSRSFSQTSTVRSRRIYDDDEEMDWEDGDGPQYSDDDYSSSEDMPYQYDPRVHNRNSYSGSNHRTYSGSQGQPGRSVLHGAFSSYSTIDHTDPTIDRLKMEMAGLRRQSQDAVNASLRLSDQLAASQEEVNKAKAALKVMENMLEDEARRRIQAEKNVEEEARRRRQAEETLRQYEAQARAQQRKPTGYPRS